MHAWELTCVGAVVWWVCRICARHYTLNTGVARVVRDGRQCRGRRGAGGQAGRRRRRRGAGGQDLTLASRHRGLHGAGGLEARGARREGGHLVVPTLALTRLSRLCTAE